MSFSAHGICRTSSGYESPVIYDLVGYETSFSSRALRSNSVTQGLSLTSEWPLRQCRGSEFKTYILQSYILKLSGLA